MFNWTDKQKDKADKTVRVKHLRLKNRRDKLLAAQDALTKAQARVDRMGAAVQRSNTEHQQAAFDRKHMDITCHACGSGFKVGARTWVAFSQDGSERLGSRCEACQAIARKISPASVYGPNWRRYVNEAGEPIDISGNVINGRKA